LENAMMEDRYSPEHEDTNSRMPEARYAYYRRCQVFRKGGEQCKAPAEKGSHICYSHAGQVALAQRRERERQAVLAEAVAQMRQRGKPDCEMADLFVDLKSINMTVAVMAKALIAGRIDCKTAGRLLVQLQTVSKLLRMVKTKPLPLIDTDNTDLREAKANLTAESLRHGEQPKSPQIYAEDGRLDKPEEQQNNLPLINTDNTDLREAKASLTEETRMALVAEVMAIASRRGWAHAPPELLSAA
jgi:hypothetical protein